MNVRIPANVAVEFDRRVRRLGYVKADIVRGLVDRWLAEQRSEDEQRDEEADRGAS